MCRVYSSPVGLIKDDVLGGFEAHRLHLLQVVHEAAGGRHKHIGITRQLRKLRPGGSKLTVVLSEV